MSGPIVLFFKALEAGERWITVRPNGPGTDGQPLLIKPAPDGSFKVIGGAGGKLNHLKLTGVKSEADYKGEVAQKQAGRREQRRMQRERDKEAGLTESKAAAREVISAQLGQHQAKFVDTVAQAMGWKPDAIRFPVEKFANASDQAVKRAERKHAAAVYKKAVEAVDQQRQRLLNDGEARAAAGLGEVPLTSTSPEQITVSDLAPITGATKGFGYAPHYGARAAARGLSDEVAKQEAEAVRPVPSDGGMTAAQKRAATGKRIADELKGIQDAPPVIDAQKIVDAKQAVALIKAEKELRSVQKQAREQKKRIATATEPVEPKAYILETGGHVDRDVVRDLENDLRTVRTRAFLGEAGKVEGGVEALGRHIGVGAYNSVNALALATTGASLIDRSVVDVLGIAGAAQVLARRMANDLTPEEMENAKQAMSSFHVDHYMATSDKALRDAREWSEMAHEIEVGDASNGGDLAAAQELNARRREFVTKAQTVLGTAFGEMEANAALVLALEQPKKSHVQVSLGRTPIEAAIRQVRAIGLDRGDYTIEKIGSSLMLSVTGDGMDKLATPVSRDDLIRTRGALDIIEGRADEDGWLPEGVSDRPELAMNAQPGVAPRVAKPFSMSSGSVMNGIEDYIGGRAADGDAPADILEGLLSEDTLRTAGDRGAFMSALNQVAPLYSESGKMIRAETHAAAFEKLADQYVGKLGGDIKPLHRQKIGVDDVSVHALHHALAANPEGVAAFTPVGDLTPQDQGALRDVFAREYGRADPKAEAVRAEIEKLDGAQPQKEIDDMFGRGVNPAWREWQAKRNEAAERLNNSTMTWGKYLQVMGSPANAYAALQDVVKSKVIKTFADRHNLQRSGEPLKIGRQVIANDLNHLDALDPDARERRLGQHRDLVDRLRNRVAGKYAAGSVADKLGEARASEEAASQAQMGLFGDDDGTGGAAPDQKPEKPLEMGERYTIGHAAEQQISGMMPIVGKMFKAGQPVSMWKPDMSGAYVGRQRAVKLIEHNRRTMLGLGVGSGKTAISLSAFTHLKAKGKAGRGLFLVPSIVQGEFHSQALTLLEPGKYQWHANPGATRDERIAAYKNPDIDFSVVTHQAFRDDVLHLAAKREGVSTSAMAERLDQMAPADRAKHLRDVLDNEGIDHNYLAVDEGHNLLNRAGKQDSRLANVVDAVSRNMPTYVNMTADPVKNDASEAFDVLRKMDPERYSDRDAFLRRYGVDTDAAKDGLRREMARHFYTGKIDPGVKAEKKEVSVKLSPEQHVEVAALDDAASRGKLARMRGDVDVEAMKTLSPGSFSGVDEAQHRAVAGRLQQSIGIMYATALHHAINGGASTDAVADIAKERKGKPGVVFVHRLDRVDDVVNRLKRDGHRVVSLTGADSSQDKDRKKRAFQAGDHDIIVCSDAGAVGANLQRGQWLAQYDTPMTAKDHAQRNGRIHRVGQKNDVELIDVVPDHPAARIARKRLAEKYDLRDIMTSPLEGLDDHGIAGYLNRIKAGQAVQAQPTSMPVPDHEMPDLEPEAQESLF
jgi:superfamily II DNA or RNA helicase